MVEKGDCGHAEGAGWRETAGAQHPGARWGSVPWGSHVRQEERGVVHTVSSAQGPALRVATREESGVLGFPSRRGLTPRGSLECNPEIPAFPGEEN